MAFQELPQGKAQRRSAAVLRPIKECLHAIAQSTPPGIPSSAHR